jgi:hypothetical protein
MTCRACSSSLPPIKETWDKIPEKRVVGVRVVLGSGKQPMQSEVTIIINTFFKIIEGIFE